MHKVLIWSLIPFTIGPPSVFPDSSSLPLSHPRYRHTHACMHYCRSNKIHTPLAFCFFFDDIHISFNLTLAFPMTSQNLSFDTVSKAVSLTGSLFDIPSQMEAFPSPPVIILPYPCHIHSSRRRAEAHSSFYPMPGASHSLCCVLAFPSVNRRGLMQTG